MKSFIITILLIIMISKMIMLGCNCKSRLAKTTELLTYSSIDEAKENHAFVAGYIPDSPFICIQGKQFNIDEAWIQYPYVQKNFYDKVIYDAYFFSMSYKSDEVGLETYKYDNCIQGVNASSRIFFYLSNYDKKYDTIIVHYQSYLKSTKMNKKLLFFKK